MAPSSLWKRADGTAEARWHNEGQMAQQRPDDAIEKERYHSWGAQITGYANAEIRLWPIMNIVIKFKIDMSISMQYRECSSPKLKFNKKAGNWMGHWTYTCCQWLYIQ